MQLIIPKDEERVSKVSIVMACLNAERTLVEALDSIYKHGGDAELIVVDGGSSDSTLSILEGYAHRIARLISEPDRGIYDALSKGFRVAKGTWIYVLGSDDKLMPGFRTMLSQLADPGVAYYGKVQFSPSGAYSRGRTTSFGLCLRNISHQAIFFPKLHWLRLGGFDKSFPLYADYAFNLKAYWDSGLTYKYFDEVVCEFYQFGAGGTQKDFAFAARKLPLVREYAPFWISTLYSMAVICKRTLLLLRSR